MCVLEVKRDVQGTVRCLLFGLRTGATVRGADRVPEGTSRGPREVVCRTRLAREGGAAELDSRLKIDRIAQVARIRQAKCRGGVYTTCGSVLPLT